jgi:hypothetical protein
MRGKKKILQRNILGKKYLALHFYRKKVSVLFPALGGKKLLHSLNLQTPPPSKIKWSAPYCEEYASEVPFPILIIIVIAFFFIGLTMWIDIQVSSLPTLAKDAEKFHEALIVYPRYL